MNIGLIDVDGHNFPNLYLMKVSAYHKSLGDTVGWWQSEFIYYDKVYMSKVFSDSYSQEGHVPMNCGEVIKGGTGYAISLKNGREVFDSSKCGQSLPEIDNAFPDYSIYPQFDFAVSMTSRGCPRGCPWCIVGKKEGFKSVKVANVSDFWCGQKEIQVLDPNITACPDKRELFRQYAETKAKIVFKQGLDIRLLDDSDIADLNGMRLGTIHFAWDNPKENLKPMFENFKAKFRRHSNIATVYLLCGFNSTMDDNLNRIYTLRDMGYDPYVMIYNKPYADKELKQLQRWCNNKWVFNTVNSFDDYKKQKEA